MIGWLADSGPGADSFKEMRPAERAELAETTTAEQREANCQEIFGPKRV
jgi:hypothetical protein